MEGKAVGIFSRSSESEYAWLQHRLRVHCEVHGIYISNNSPSVLSREIGRCGFAVLYHTKNRGRVNITDVTDSLYDEEIRLLSKSLGRSRVVVVIDDLEDSSDQVKERILDSQPTLRSCTQDVFLVTQREKRDERLLMLKVQPIIYLILRGAEEPRGVERYLVVAELLSLSAKTIHRTYLSPSIRNLVLFILWTATLLRMFRKPLVPILPLKPCWRCAVSGGVALCSILNTYYSPSIPNVILSAWWLAASSTRLVCGSGPSSGLNPRIRRMAAYGLAGFSFWIGCRMADPPSDLKMICQTVLLSPAVLAAQ